MSTTTITTATTEPNPANIVFNVDVFLLCVWALCVLLSLPRAAIRFTHLSEWTDGHLLRTVSYYIPSHLRRDVAAATPPAPTPARLHPTRTPAPYDADPEKHAGADLSRANTVGTLARSNTAASHAPLLHTRRHRVVHARNLPTHMPGWCTLLPRTHALLTRAVRPGLTLGNLLLLLAYTSLILTAGLWRSNPFTQPVRAGWVAASQVPVVVALATKNNLVGMLMGAGYAKLNYLHRFAARFFIVAINVHAIGYFYAWFLSGTFAARLATPSHAWALVGLIAADAIAASSTVFWRNRAYNFFLAVHVIGISTLMMAICFHAPPVTPYVLVAVGAYAFDRTVRVFKTRVAIAHVRALPGLGTTRVEVPTINAGWRAGQHVRVRVLDRRMGRVGWAESHPFSIASVSKSHDEEGLVLLCKTTGKWTTKLHEIAKTADYEGGGGDVRVLIEGPYAGPGHTVWASFSGAMFVAGGSGISFALSAVQDLMQKDAEGRSRVKVIELVWTVQDPSSLLPLLPLFSALLAQSDPPYTTALRIAVHYTRAPGADALKALGNLPAGLALAPGRPRVVSLLESVVDRTCALYTRGVEVRRGNGGLMGVAVGVCGPAGLGEEVKGAVRNVDPARRQRVGGMELHQETFGW